VRNNAVSECGFDDALNMTYCRLELLKANSVADFMARIHRLIRGLGFSDFSVTRMNSRSDPDAHLVSTPRVMSDYYREESVWRNDFMLQHAAHSLKPVFHGDIDEFLLDSPVVTDSILSNLGARRIRLDLGFTEYYGMPISAANGNGNILMAVTSTGMSAEEFRVRVRQKQNSIRMIADAIDYVGTKRFSSFFLGQDESDKILVHPKPLRLLLAIASENLSLKDAARKLCISESTANQHIAAAKKALGANTTASAVYKAIQCGLIDCR
jgi:FixJ family two-component response regulator